MKSGQPMPDQRCDNFLYSVQGRTFGAPGLMAPGREQ
jgi:hypothetical protein